MRDNTIKCRRMILNIYSVSEITKYIKRLIDVEQTLQTVLIRGELSNFKKHYSGHCYFTLKDQQSSIKCVMFKNKAQFLKFMPQDGMQIVVSGYITIFERDGQYQLYADSLFPDGIGELSLAFAQLKEKLTMEGLFDSVHKKILPYFPKKIGVITSATGAVLRDIYTVSKRRNPQIQLCLYPVKVQGDEAPFEIVHAIAAFNTKFPVDVIIVGRGGGSIEDLWAFNDEKVVRAVFESAIPIVSAVGHETDYTLTDFVSDVRAATPSQAAELIVPDVKELLHRIRILRDKMDIKVKHILSEKRHRINLCKQKRILSNPQFILDRKRELLDKCVERMGQGKCNQLLQKRHGLEVLLEKLLLLNPLAALNRGYTIAKQENILIKSIKQVKKDENLTLYLADGKIDTKVTCIGEGTLTNGSCKK